MGYVKKFILILLMDFFWSFSLITNISTLVYGWQYEKIPFLRCNYFKILFLNFMNNLSSMDFCKIDYVQSWLRNLIFFGQFDHLSEMNCWNFGGNWTKGGLVKLPLTKILKKKKKYIEMEPKCLHEVAHPKIFGLPILCLGDL